MKLLIMLSSLLRSPAISSSLGLNILLIKEPVASYLNLLSFVCFEVLRKITKNLTSVTIPSNPVEI